MSTINPEASAAELLASLEKLETELETGRPPAAGADHLAKLGDDFDLPDDDGDYDDDPEALLALSAKVERELEAEARAATAALTPAALAPSNSAPAYKAPSPTARQAGTPAAPTMTRAQAFAAESARLRAASAKRAEQYTGA